jgi:hypothetical protein
VDAAAAFAKDGFVRLPGLVDARERRRLAAICERICALWLAEDAVPPGAGRATNMACLTDPRWYAGRREDLLDLLAFIARPDILALAGRLLGGPVRFHNTQLFHRPPAGAWNGLWHRDSQFLEPDQEEEWRAIQAARGLHIRVALVPDERLSIVPGSHRRRDTPAEAAIRHCPCELLRRDGAMPGAVPIRLAAGDGLAFDAWSIHRGRYDAAEPRATLDVIFGRGPVMAGAEPPPTCFLDARLMADLPPEAGAFFGRFVAAFRDHWARHGLDGGPLG